MIPILQYHQVTELPVDLDNRMLAVPPTQFKQQMAYLYGAGYRCLRLDEAIGETSSGRRRPQKNFTLTFDDGFRDAYTTVPPILAHYGFIATIFVVTGRMGRGSNWDKQEGEGAARLMSWAEAAELARAGYTFGSHTVTHPRLPHLDDEAVCRELLDSKAALEDHLGVSVDFLAYPYNASDTRVQRLAAECGYVAACGGDLGPSGRFNLRRTECSRRDTPWTFALKARGTHARFQRLRELGSLARRGFRGTRDAVAPPADG